MQTYNLQDKEYTFGRRLFWNPQLIETPNAFVLMLVGYHQQQPQQNNSIWQTTSGRFANPYNPYIPYTRLPTHSSNLTYIYDYVATVGFDKQSGRLLWDNMMKIEEIEQDIPQDIVQTAFMGDSLITAYLKDEKAYSQLSYKREIPLEPQSQETKFILEGKLVDKIEDAELHTWQGAYMLMTGTFRRMQVAEGLSKYVFFVTKLRYKPTPK